ncbi:MAG: phage Gp19/Gp15/Gp42 family protein [Bacillota bacterium]|nr:phage Gp19/Gp15/Gp42 family protein [Bacillota bacterium]
MNNFATLDDVQLLWRTLNPDEIERAKGLLEVISDSLRVEAGNVGKDLDVMITENHALRTVAKSVTVDVLARTLMTKTDSEPMSQFSESALGYTISGTYLIPGGGLFIKDSELKRLGLKKQRYGVLSLWEESEE